MNIYNYEFININIYNYEFINDYKINSISKYLDDMYNKYLKNCGIKLPKKGKMRSALEYLVENINKAVDIRDIQSYVISCGYLLKGGDPIQVRHLSTQYGFYIIKENNKFKLISLIIPYPSFIKDKRNIKITNDSWLNIIKDYDYMCVNCGSEELKELRWKKTEKTKLQKGHMDPRKSLTEDNCIPQCQFCNQRYTDKAVFDKRGQVIKLLK